MEPIGIFGGTFDPIHVGHLRTAFELWQALHLTEVRFLPTGNPPHRSETRANAELRLAMVRAAVEGQDLEPYGGGAHERCQENLAGTGVFDNVGGGFGHGQRHLPGLRLTQPERFGHLHGSPTGLANLGAIVDLEQTLRWHVAALCSNFIANGRL